jgi:glycosyltransferase involved in cell wall biosynthesis
MHYSVPHIIIINDFAHINGGVGQVALSSAMALSDKGYPIIVFSAVPPVMSELDRQNLKIICTNQHEIMKDPNRVRSFLQGIWNPIAMRSMANLLDTFDSSNTVIHVHSWTKALSSSVVRVAIKKGFKVICTMHDYFLSCPNGGFFNYRENQICSVLPLSRQCILKNCDVRSYPQKLWRIGRQIAQKNFGLIPGGIKHFIAVSDFSRRLLHPFLPKDANIYLVSNPVNVSKGEPAKVSFNNAFIYVGRLSKEKGPHLFARAASALGIKAVFVGDGPMRNQLSHIYTSSTFTGWLSPHEVIGIMRTARALVLPSLCYETQGLVALEAAAMGVPVIVADNSAAREVIVDGVTGLWFKSGDVNDLQKKITILQNQELAKEMSRATYERYWVNPYTIGKHSADILNVYDEVLES